MFRMPVQSLDVGLMRAFLFLVFGLGFWAKATLAQDTFGYPASVVSGLAQGRSGVNHAASAILRDGSLLVAARKLQDRNFARSIVLILRYGSEGAIGLIVNRPSRVHFTQLLPRMANTHLETTEVYRGGPVARDTVTLLLRAAHKPFGTREILQGVFAGAQMSTLGALLEEPGLATEVRAFVGYSGWAEGQLESEIARGDWHVTAATAELVFGAGDDDDWRVLIKSLSGTWVHVPVNDPAWLGRRMTACAPASVRPARAPPLSVQCPTGGTLVEGDG